MWHNDVHCMHQKLALRARRPHSHARVRIGPQGARHIGSARFPEPWSRSSTAEDRRSGPNGVRYGTRKLVARPNLRLRRSRQQHPNRHRSGDPATGYLLVHTQHNSSHPDQQITRESEPFSQPRRTPRGTQPGHHRRASLAWPWQQTRVSSSYIDHHVLNDNVIAFGDHAAGSLAQPSSRVSLGRPVINRRGAVDLRARHPRYQSATARAEVS